MAPWWITLSFEYVLTIISNRLLQKRVSSESPWLWFFFRPVEPRRGAPLIIKTESLLWKRRRKEKANRKVSCSPKSVCTLCWSWNLQAGSGYTHHPDPKEGYDLHFNDEISHKYKGAYVGHFQSWTRLNISAIWCAIKSEKCSDTVRTMYTG